MSTPQQNVLSLVLLQAADSQAVQAMIAKYSINVDPSIVKIINQICVDCPTLFPKITTGITNIFADGKLNASDIPQLFLLCADMYESQVLSKVKGVTGAQIIDAIKVTILILLDNNVIKIQGVTNDVIIATVNTCAFLLDRILGTKTVASCFSCIHW